jgi:hypothetical protein
LPPPGGDDDDDDDEDDDSMNSDRGDGDGDDYEDDDTMNRDRTGTDTSRSGQSSSHRSLPGDGADEDNMSVDRSRLVLDMRIVHHDNESDMVNVPDSDSDNGNYLNYPSDPPSFAPAVTSELPPSRAEDDGYDYDGSDEDENSGGPALADDLFNDDFSDDLSYDPEEGSLQEDDSVFSYLDFQHDDDRSLALSSKASDDEEYGRNDDDKSVDLVMEDSGQHPVNGSMMSRHEAHLENVQDPANKSLGRGPLTRSEKATTELLALLLKSGAPLALFDKIVDWHQEYGAAHEYDARGEITALGVPLELKKRKPALNDLFKRYNLEHLSPEEVPTHLPDADKTVAVIRNDIEACTYYLLTHPVIMQPRNLLFDVNDPLGNRDGSQYISEEEEDFDDSDFYDSDHETANIAAKCSDRGDINTGLPYRAALKRYGKGIENHCGWVLFCDATPLDSQGRSGLEPVMGTLSIFNQETRNRPEAWVCLGFIPRMSTTTAEAEECQEAPVNEKRKKQQGLKGTLEDYHAMLETILAPLKKIQLTGLSWDWKYSGLPACRVNLRFDIEMVLGDAPGLDKLCGLRGKCRYCDCSKEDLDSSKSEFKLTKMSTVSKWANSGAAFETRKRKTDAKGYHRLKHNAFFGLRFSNRKYGINGCTPAEILHLLYHGLYRYGLIGYCNLQVR